MPQQKNFQFRTNENYFLSRFYIKNNNSNQFYQHLIQNLSNQIEKKFSFSNRKFYLFFIENKNFKIKLFLHYELFS